MNRLFTLLVVLSFVGCKAQTYKMDELPQRRISFGNLGGFAGSYTSYVLLENGQLFYISTYEKKELKKISAFKAKHIFKEAEELIEEGVSLNEKANLTNFIIFNSGSKDTEWNWAQPVGNSKALSKDLEEILELNESLIKLIKQTN